MAVCTDERELAAVIEQHLPLVRHVVFQAATHFPRHVDREELARAGALGLVEAAHRYDGSRGVPFERYAAQRIRGAMLDAVRAADWAPRSLRTSSRRMESTRQSLASDLGRQPTDAELASALHVEVDELTALRTKVQQAVVLALDEQVTNDDEQSSLVELLPDQTAEDPDEALERQELHGYLRDAVHLLPERHRLVVVGYFLEGRTSAELAALLAVTESRVSQLRSEALDMLRDGLTAQFDGTARAGGRVKGRVARRKAAYASAIANERDRRSRLLDA
jgi:RNA polymerase sigma factor for flagellar operon FliA